MKKIQHKMEEVVKQMILASIRKRLVGWDNIDNLMSNEDLIKQWMTDIMALGYNNYDVEAAAQDIFDFQSRFTQVSIEDLRCRVCLSFNRFGEETSAFQQYVELRDSADEETIKEAVAEELENVKEGEFILA